MPPIPFIFLPASNPLFSQLTGVFFTDCASLIPAVGSSFLCVILLPSLLRLRVLFQKLPLSFKQKNNNTLSSKESNLLVTSPIDTRFLLNIKSHRLFPLNHISCFELRPDVLIQLALAILTLLDSLSY